MPLTVVEHPIAAHYLTILRSKTTKTQEFREVSRRLAFLLVTDATKDLQLTQFEVSTPLEPTTGFRISTP